MTEHSLETPVEQHFNFFIPGEVVLIVEHDEPLSAEALLSAVREIPFVSENDTLTRAVAQVDPSISVTTLARQPQGSSKVEGRGCSQIISMILDLLFNRNLSRSSSSAKSTIGPSTTYLSSIFLDVGQVTDEWKNPRAFIERFIAPQIEGLEGGRGHGDKVSITTLAPNWLISGAQPILTVGGPGARPVAPNRKTLSAYGSVEPWRFRFFREGEQVIDMGDGKGVDIFVLDTAPTAPQFERAYDNPQVLNPLLRQMIAPDGRFSLANRRFEVRYSQNSPIDAEMRRLSSHREGAAESGHTDYEMGDHGLFASGIAASIAPEAHVVLIEILGRWGVGSLHTVVQALGSLSNRSPERPMVVNLSLTFDIPLGKHVSHRANVPLFAVQYKLFRAEWGWFTDWLDAHESYVRRSLMAVEEACRVLVAHHRAVIVAASGNDSFGAPQWCAPRFPAAFDDVTGVGALGSDQKPAPYTNRPDTPEAVGVITFGGNIDPVSGSPGTTPSDHMALSTDADEGILGLYIGTLPGALDGTSSEDGWARWAGTSFATPIVSGFLAAALSEGKSPAEALEVVRNAAIEPAGQSQMLRVVQG